MAKRFKLRIYEAISSSLQSCCSKDSTSLPLDPVPSFFQLSPPNNNIIKTSIPPPFSKSSSSIKRHVSSTFISTGCGLPSKSSASTTEITKDLEWKKEEEEEEEEEEWEIVISPHLPTKLNYSPTESITPPTSTTKKRRTRKKKTTSTTITKHRVSTSSADNDSAFSSDETEKLKKQTHKILISSSSRSFSMDSNSTDFNPHLQTIREKPRHRIKKKKKKKKKTSSKRCVSNKELLMCSDDECEVPARLSVFKKLIPCAVEGKVKESFAVVKKSDDPYDDFKKSMMDMIWEKQLFEEVELEQLLQCFLSLNSPHHHRLIVDVFTQIWNAMFSTALTTTS